MDLRNQRTKQTFEEYNLEMDYRPVLPIGALVLSSVSLSAIKWPSGEPATISAGDEILSSFSGVLVEPNKTKTTFWIRGGTNNYTYQISVLATFDNGSKLKDEVFVRVMDAPGFF